MGRLNNAYLGVVARTQTAGWRLKERLTREDGQTSTEYLMIAGAVAVILVGLLATFRGQISAAFGKISSSIGKAVK